MCLGEGAVIHSHGKEKGERACLVSTTSEAVLGEEKNTNTFLTKCSTKLNNPDQPVTLHHQ